MSVVLDAEELLLGILDAIEQREARLLVWGLVDGRLSHDELRELIDPLLDQAIEKGIEDFFTADDVIQVLSERGLLFTTDNNPYAGHRSRMAETVRLAFRLRQLFPKHRSVDAWQQARTLVADFRFTRRRRRYPRRDCDLIAVAAALDQRLEDPVLTAVLKALLDGRGEGFRLAEFQARATQRVLEGLAGGRSSGTLVSAGTGSGKTLAFYLPAMARVAALRIRRGYSRGWVKLLAIYPRTELLRDQFAEVYAEARRLDGLLDARGAGKIRIGALFGETPQSASSLKRSYDNRWRRVADGTFAAIWLARSTVAAGICYGEMRNWRKTTSV